jgi:hypothetical protein
MIIGIHGLANKPPQATLAEWWELALREGLSKNLGWADQSLPFQLVYWADLLYKFPIHDDQLMSFDDLYNEEPYHTAVPEALERREETLLDQIRGGLLDLVSVPIDLARRNVDCGGVIYWLLTKLYRDLAFYYDEAQEVRDREGNVASVHQVLDRELSRQILAAHEDPQVDEILLVAHSMGSIIAYNALRDLGQSHPDLEISHFVTIGSPLGLPLVRSQICQERDYDPVVRTPTVVTKRWVNFADPKDLVALDIRLRDDYGANRRGIQVEDDLVNNDYQTIVTRCNASEVKRNHHKSYGYLRAPEFSELVAGFLEG